MIEPAQAAKKPLASQEALPRTEREPRQGEAPTGTGEVQLAEREKQVTPTGPTFDVRLDGETMRLYSELRDPETDRVLLRLPAGYEPESEAPENGVSTEA
jgi:hypothetical protein